MNESAIQRMILARLLVSGHGHWWRCNTGMARTRSGYVRFGPPGQPDIQGCLRGRWIGIEVKSATGKLRPEQEAFRKRIEEAGGAYIIARNWEDVANAIRRFTTD